MNKKATLHTMSPSRFILIPSTYLFFYLHKMIFRIFLFLFFSLYINSFRCTMPSHGYDADFGQGPMCDESGNCGAFYYSYYGVPNPHKIKEQLVLFVPNEIQGTWNGTHSIVNKLSFHSNYHNNQKNRFINSFHIWLNANNTIEFGMQLNTNNKIDVIFQYLQRNGFDLMTMNSVNDFMLVHFKNVFKTLSTPQEVLQMCQFLKKHVVLDRTNLFYYFHYRNRYELYDFICETGKWKHI